MVVPVLQWISALLWILRVSQLLWLLRALHPERPGSAVRPESRFPRQSEVAPKSIYRPPQPEQITWVRRSMVRECRKQVRSRLRTIITPPGMGRREQEIAQSRKQRFIKQILRWGARRICARCAGG